jgi:hypothetical protein
MVSPSAYGFGSGAVTESRGCAGLVSGIRQQLILQMDVAAGVLSERQKRDYQGARGKRQYVYADEAGLLAGIKRPASSENYPRFNTIRHGPKQNNTDTFEFQARCPTRNGFRSQGAKKNVTAGDRLKARNQLFAGTIHKLSTPGSSGDATRWKGVGRSM